MALTLPQLKGVSNIIGENRGVLTFSSDYSDFLLGTNWQTLYYGYMLNNGVADEILWPTTFTSETASTTIAAASSATYVKEIDLDFDSAMQAERIVGGWAKITGKIRGSADNGYAVFKLVKYTAATSTEVKIGETKSDEGLGAGHDFTLMMEVTRTQFSQEDILRLTVEVWAKDATPDGTVILDHDGTYKIDVPFSRLDEY